MKCKSELDFYVHYIIIFVIYYLNINILPLARTFFQIEI